MTADTDIDTRPAPNRPIVLFDGVCNLCNGLVAFLIPRDPDGRLQFAALQSEAGQELLTRHGLSTEEFASILYDVVADNRYDWFGRKDQCMIPDEDVSDRFL